MFSLLLTIELYKKAMQDKKLWFLFCFIPNLNKQKLSYQLWEEKIPLSKHLRNYLEKNNLKKSNFISNGDDYQILFTAGSDKSRIIESTSKKLGIKITKIGKIILNNKKSSIITKKGKYLLIKNSGYKHQF